MLYAQQVNCPVCDAGVPFGQAGWTICPFCLHRFEIPGKIQIPQAQNVQLERSLLEGAIQLRGLESFGDKDWIKVLFYGGIYGMPIVFMFSQWFTNSMPTHTVIFILSFSIAPLMAIVLATIYKKKAATAGIAALKPVTLRLENGLSAYCPECGAAVRASHRTLTTRCAHCRTESLLPAVMVGNMMQEKYAAVAKLRRKRIRVERKVDAAGVDRKAAGIIFETIGILTGILILVTAKGASPENFKTALLVAGVVSGSLISAGLWVMLRKN